MMANCACPGDMPFGTPLYVYTLGGNITTIYLNLVNELRVKFTYEATYYRGFSDMCVI